MIRDWWWNIFSVLFSVWYSQPVWRACCWWCGHTVRRGLLVSWFALPSVSSAWSCVRVLVCSPAAGFAGLCTAGSGSYMHPGTVSWSGALWTVRDKINTSKLKKLEKRDVQNYICSKSISWSKSKKQKKVMGWFQIDLTLSLRSIQMGRVYVLKNSWNECKIIKLNAVILNNQLAIVGKIVDLS